MAIKDLAAAAQTRFAAPHRTCQVCHAMALIAPSEAEALKALLANPGVRYTELRDALAADEDTPLVLSADALSRHARGECGAERLR